MCWDLGLGNHLCDLLSDSSCKVPHIAVALVTEGPGEKKREASDQFRIHH